MFISENLELPSYMAMDKYEKDKMKEFMSNFLNDDSELFDEVDFDSPEVYELDTSRFEKINESFIESQKILQQSLFKTKKVNDPKYIENLQSHCGEKEFAIVISLVKEIYNKVITEPRKTGLPQFRSYADTCDGIFSAQFDMTKICPESDQFTIITKTEVADVCFYNTKTGFFEIAFISDVKLSLLYGSHREKMLQVSEFNLNNDADESAQVLPYKEITSSIRGRFKNLIAHHPLDYLYCQLEFMIIALNYLFVGRRAYQQAGRDHIMEFKNNLLPRLDLESKSRINWTEYENSEELQKRLNPLQILRMKKEGPAN